MSPCSLFTFNVVCDMRRYDLYSPCVLVSVGFHFHSLDSALLLLLNRVVLEVDSYFASVVCRVCFARAIVAIWHTSRASWGRLFVTYRLNHPVAASVVGIFYSCRRHSKDVNNDALFQSTFLTCHAITISSIFSVSRLNVFYSDV